MEKKPKTILRKRHQIDCSHPKKTEQAHKKMCDINNIMESYRKTGMLPQFKQKQPFFADVSNVPSIEEAYETVQNARESFMELPSDIRKLMDNDPRKLESFVQNSDNHEMLRKYGLIAPAPKPEPEPVKTEKTPQNEA